MERHEILEAMSELKLYGMRANFDEIAGKGLTRRDEIYPLIASLIRAERTHRQARSISYRIGGAKFPVLKDLDKFVFADTPVDEGLVRELATGSFLDAKRNAIKGFITWMVSDGQNFTEALAYARLPHQVVAQELKALSKVQ